MITWSKSTKPCLIITWDGVVFNGEQIYVDHIYYMIHVWPFGLQCSEAMSVHARLVKFNPSILHVQNCLTPVVFEHRAYHTRSSRGVSARRTFATLHNQGECHSPRLLLVISCTWVHHGSCLISRKRNWGIWSLKNLNKRRAKNPGNFILCFQDVLMQCLRILARAIYQTKI